MSYHNIQITDQTRAMRGRLRGSLDPYAYFIWRGVNSFDDFGAFIINGGDDLKFYHGPSYTNNYTQPQFESSSGNLTGVTFSTWQISFKIGVYWISEDHYRHLLDWLNPYEINTLQFGYEPNYGFMAKLAKVDDGIKYVVGREMASSNTEGGRIFTKLPASTKTQDMYYSEFNITFDVVGTPCARSIYPWEWKNWEIDNNTSTDQIKHYKTSINTTNKDVIGTTDLRTPLKMTFQFLLESDILISDPSMTIVLTAKYGTNSQELFTVNLTNLSINPKPGSEVADLNPQNEHILCIRYDSETGLLFLQYGNGREKLLTLQNTTTTGERMVTSYQAYKFFIPGRFDDPNFDLSALSFDLMVKSVKPDEWFRTAQSESSIESYARTNLI